MIPGNRPAPGRMQEVPAKPRSAGANPSVLVPFNGGQRRWVAMSSRVQPAGHRETSGHDGTAVAEARPQRGYGFVGDDPRASCALNPATTSTAPNSGVIDLRHCTWSASRLALTRRLAARVARAFLSGTRCSAGFTSQPRCHTWACKEPYPLTFPCRPHWTRFPRHDHRKVRGQDGAAPTR